MTTARGEGVAAALRVGAVELVVPEGWEQLPEPDADALLVAPKPPRRVFRANVVVTSRPSSGSASTHLEHVVHAAATAGRVLAMEPAPWIGRAGRRIESVYLVERTAVRVSTWATRAGGRDLEVTLSRLLLPPSAVRDAVERIETSLVVHGAEEDDLAGPPLPPMPGAELEEPVSFPPISGDAWRLLWASFGHGFQPGPARTPAGRELREAGLMSPFGGTTPDAERFLRIARAGRRGTIQRRDADGGAIRSIWSADGEAAVGLGRIEGEPPAVVSHALSLEPAGPAAVRLLDWMGIAPASGRGGGERLDVPEDAVESRLRGSTPAPDGAGPGLLAAWRSDGWTAFDLLDAGAPAVLRVLRAGDGTWWMEGPTAQDGVVHLRALSGSAMIDVLTGGGPSL